MKSCLIKIYKIKFSLLSLFIILVYLTGCKKFVDLGPQRGTLTDNSVFTDNTTAIAAISGIYTRMAGNTGIFTGVNSITYLAGLSADEFTLFSGISADIPNAYFKNSLSAIAPPITGSETWAPLYDLIYECNSALKGLNDPSAVSLTPSVRKYLQGEAHFLRAFFYFYLVNLYGPVPLVIGTDPQVNLRLTRSSAPTVYKHIIEDLLVAKDLLPGNYLNNSFLATSNERVSATKWAANALLARVYLYTGQAQQAEMTASEVIAQTSLFDTLSLNNVFQKNSKEAILQLQPTTQYFNTSDGRLFNITAAGPNGSQPVFLSPQLKAAFEKGDNRYKPGNWVNYRVIGGDTLFYPFKYKLFAQDTSINPRSGTQNMGEYLTVFRIAEQYLIRAEARILQNKIAEGINDINVLRKRARGPLPGDLPALSTSLSADLAMTALMHERQTELFSEWGHRWLDLKRTNRVDAVMSVVTPVKSGSTVQWQSYQQFYPIPQADLNKAPNLTQNAGY